MIPLPSIAEDDLRRCIHCGLCLEACPTYPLGGREGDAPRGRIQLLRAFAEQSLVPDTGALDPIRTCLGCGACEPACPSGVEYLRILAGGRETLHQRIDDPLPPAARFAKNLLLRALASPTVLGAIGAAVKTAARLGLVDLLHRSRIPGEIGGILPTLVGMLPSSENGGDPRRSAIAPPPGSETIDLFRGCIAPILLPGVEPAARRLLAAAGYEVRLPAGQGCCGALAWHHGDPKIARACLRRNLRAFAGGSGPIVVTAAGCGAALREAPEWLGEGDPLHGAARALAARVRDLTEILDERSYRLRMKECARKAAFQDPCHLKQVQGISGPPRRLLRRIPGLILREADGAPNCCGSAGLYSFIHAEISRRLAGDLLDCLAPDSVSWLVTANPGCLFHLRDQARKRGMDLRVLHIAEALAHSLDDAAGCGTV